MLLSLRINNYALIEELYVDFHKGLNIITGETGAGKSILLGALGLILGKRADTSVLSNQDNKCIVEAEFNVKGYRLQDHFNNADVDYDDHTVFRREILSSGKSRAFVNDTPVTLGVLQSLALHLVDIHSQHQNLLLNQQEFLLNIIDRYSNNSELLNAYSASFKSYKLKNEAYQKALSEYESIKSDVDYLTHQVNELAEAKLVGGEVQQLEEELTQLEYSGEIKAALHEATAVLSSEEVGVLQNLQSILSGLKRIQKYYPDAEAYANRLESARIELKELDADLSLSFEKLDFDPNHHQKVKDRLDLLNGLMQKYRVSSDTELIEKYQQLSERFSLGVDGEYNIDKQREELENIKSKTIELADRLSQDRQAVFAEIESKVVVMLQELGIEHGTLKIDRTEQDLAALGNDNLSFLFSANKNHPLKDVSKIASGGELSRLMLSIKALLSSSVGMPTVILDEIDTGVSGDIADKVGNIIRYMGQGMQVVNITHLPQVASKAEAHFKVYKDHNDNYTKTRIKRLSDEERLNEIAQMLSGEVLTEAAIENARALLEN